MDKEFEFSISAPSLQVTLLSREDLEWARQIRNDESTRYFLGDDRIVSFEDQQRWFDLLQYNSKSKRLIVKQNNINIGLIRLDSIDKFNKSICIGMDIDPKHRGQGLAKPIYRHLMSHLFSLGFNRLWLFVIDFNTRAHTLYKDLGFIEEGKQREAILRDGKYHDYIMMSRLGSDRGLD